MLCISGHRAAGIFTDFTEEPKSVGINSTSKVKASCKHPRQQRSVARENSSHKFSSAQYAVKFEDRSREETGRQERCALGDAWIQAKNILKLVETDLPTNGV